MGPDVSGLDAGSSSSEDDDSGFANIPGSDDGGKKGAAKGGAEKGVKGARSKARATKRAKKRGGKPRRNCAAERHHTGARAPRKLAGRGAFRPPVAALALTHA